MLRNIGRKPIVDCPFLAVPKFIATFAAKLRFKRNLELSIGLSNTTFLSGNTFSTVSGYIISRAL